VLHFLNERAAANFEVWTVCLDEFQEIRGLGGAQNDWQLRGLTQNHRSLNYLFVGSDQRLAGWMTEPMTPVSKQLQQMEVGPMAGDDLARWIDRRARAGGPAQFFLRRPDRGCCRSLHGGQRASGEGRFSLSTGKTPKDIVAMAFDAIALGELQDEFLNHWRSLPPTSAECCARLPTARPPWPRTPCASTDCGRPRRPRRRLKPSWNGSSWCARMAARFSTARSSAVGSLPRTAARLTQGQSEILVARRFSSNDHQDFIKLSYGADILPRDHF